MAAGRRKTREQGPRPVIVWFRQDLRLADNPALDAAVASGRPVVPVFVLEDEARRPLGGAGRWWLHQSLAQLQADLVLRGSRLVILRGEMVTVLSTLAQETGAQAVYWNRCYEPEARRADQQISSALEHAGVSGHVHKAALLREPGAVITAQGGPYQVFTPFYKTFLKGLDPGPLMDAPARIAVPRTLPESLTLEELDLEPAVDWAGGLREAWTPGEAGALAELDRFLAGPVARYDQDRDRPGLAGTSRLSPHLHWGEISPARVWWTARKQAGSAAAPFLRQLVWREFAHHLLHHFPHTVDSPLREKFAAFPWDGDPDLLDAWQEGRTGYPLVDAGMRELWNTGWMHNRVRMVAASFLVKHLLLPWQLGVRWFADTLVDADLANNTFGWQWSAGCGADAAPYFRIFNPVLQGLKFDSRGDYIRCWIPELAGVPGKLVHEPWTASPGILEQHGVRLGRDYPHPVVDHATARARALQSYQRMQAG
jgi:deoxyribodipyrimidine photo-lyase